MHLEAIFVPFKGAKVHSAAKRPDDDDYEDHQNNQAFKTQQAVKNLTKISDEDKGILTINLTGCTNLQVYVLHIGLGLDHIHLNCSQEDVCRITDRWYEIRTSQKLEQQPHFCISYLSVMSQCWLEILRLYHHWRLQRLWLWVWNQQRVLINALCATYWSSKTIVNIGTTAWYYSSTLLEVTWKWCLSSMSQVFVFMFSQEITNKSTSNSDLNSPRMAMKNSRARWFHPKYCTSNLLKYTCMCFLKLCIFCAGLRWGSGPIRSSEASWPKAHKARSSKVIIDDKWA